MAEFRRKNLGQKLIDAGLITLSQYESAMQRHSDSQVSLRQVLVDMGYVTEEKMMDFVGECFEIEVVKELFTKIENPDIVSALPEKSCRQYGAIPLSKIDDVLTVAMADPLDVFVVDDIEKLAKCKIKPVLASKADILKTLDIFYKEDSGGDLHDIVKDMAEEEEGLEVINESKDEEALDDEEIGIVDAPIIRLVNTIISQAIKERASDIHVEPDDKTLRIRYRIDGILRETMSPPKKFQAPITSRIKIMAGMDISIKRASQDGRFRLRVENGDYDVRISTVPTIYGEKVVMRLLDQTSIKIGLDESGLSSDNMTHFRELIDRPYGIVLVTGPTGSGKTTTLYLALQMINSPDKNIITIEEPVEYDLEGINQIAVNIKAGVTFANGLKSILRQDPDVIMVGEMRDLETADIAVRAALTGHLVFSTLHTNDAPGSVARMIDMGVPPYLVTSSVCCVLAQRLVRMVCPKCKEAYKPSEKEMEDAGILDGDVHEPVFYKGRGCTDCGETGYFGRTGLFELMVVDKELRGLIHGGKSTDVIREAAQKAGMKTLWQDGVDKILKGMTTLDELKRVTYVEQG